MTNVMTRAWTIAKEAVTKFGGRVKEYFAESLKMAWVLVKNENGAFDTRAVVSVGKKGEYGFVAIPADAKIERVVDGEHLVTPKEYKGNDGNMYNVYRVAMNFNFKVVTNDNTHLFKMISDGCVFYNGITEGK